MYTHTINNYDVVTYIKSKCDIWMLGKISNFYAAMTWDVSGEGEVARLFWSASRSEIGFCFNEFYHESWLSENAHVDTVNNSEALF